MAASGQATKVKALLLIVLLVGHEGVRVSSNVFDTASRSPLEAQWSKEQSEHCVWKFRGCVGRAGEACKYRPFALDRGPSCRLRKTYMLHDKQLTETLLKLEIALMTESADFFKRKCNGKLGTFQARSCLRRLGHIIRALNFLVRVQASNEAIINMYGAVIRTHIDEAIAAISSVLKDTQPDYENLTDKVRVNAVKLAKDPVSSTVWIRDTVRKLANHNETEQMEGRKRVGELPSSAPQTLNEEDLEQLRKVVAKLSADVDPEEESEAFRKLQEMLPDSAGVEHAAFNERGEALTGLLQQSEGFSIFPSKESLVILAECILVILLIVTIVYSLQNMGTIPLNQFTGALAGQIGTIAIVYFASGVDFAAAKPPAQPRPPVQSAPANPSLVPRGERRKGHGRKRKSFPDVPKTTSLNYSN